MNGDETGIDCGGSCALICPAESLPLLSQGDPKIIEVVPDVYEVVALFKNPNISAEVKRARYVVNIYGSQPEPIKTIESETFIPKNGQFVVFEGPFNIDNAEPQRVSVQWRAETLIWEKTEESEQKPSVRDVVLSGEDTSPRVDALLVNDSLSKQNNIEAVALVYDADSNIIAASKTFVDELLPDQTAPIVFSWPLPFSTEASKVEILSRLLPDTSFIR